MRRDGTLAGQPCAHARPQALRVPVLQKAADRPRFGDRATPGV